MNILSLKIFLLDKKSYIHSMLTCAFSLNTYALPINVDGEPCLQTPAIIEFHPKQLWLRGSKDVSWDVS